MLIPLGILASAGSAPTGTYELIETISLGSNAASVTFSNLGTYSSTYKHLQIRGTARTQQTLNADDIIMRFNGDTGSNYSHHLLVGNGSSNASYNAINSTSMRSIYADAQDTATSWGAGVVDILDSFSTTKNKTIRSLTGKNGNSTREIQVWSGAWRNTNSVTSITLSTSSLANISAGSRFSIYGIKG